MKSFSFLYGFGKTPLKLLNLCYLQFNYKWQLIFCHGFVREANLEFSICFLMSKKKENASQYWTIWNYKCL